MAVAGSRPSRLLLLLMALLPACTGEGASGDGPSDAPGDFPDSDPFPRPVTVVDAEGRRLVLTDPPTRIVSLVPAASRVLLELGAGDRLVGRTEHDTLTALATLPSVGEGCTRASRSWSPWSRTS